MRNEVTGFEQLAVTHRVQLETLGNVERYALSFTTGLWHETVEREASKFSRADAKAPAVIRYYRPAESPITGTKLEPRVDDAGNFVVTLATMSRGRQQPQRDITLAKQRDSWELLSVHASGQRAYNLLSEVKMLAIWTRCTACQATRNFHLKLWLDQSLTLGCARCHGRTGTTARKHTAENIPTTKGLYKLERVDTIEPSHVCGVPKLVVWARCMGPRCGGSMHAFRPSAWADMKIRLACLKCNARGRAISDEKRQQIVTALRAGALVGSIARTVGVHKSTVDRMKLADIGERTVADHEAFNAQAAS